MLWYHNLMWALIQPRASRHLQENAKYSIKVVGHGRQKWILQMPRVKGHLKRVKWQPSPATLKQFRQSDANSNPIKGCPAMFELWVVPIFLQKRKRLDPRLLQHFLSATLMRSFISDT